MKRYYDREEELRILGRQLSLVPSNQCSRLVVITGRRRVGKTQLIWHAMRNSDVPFIYLFSSRTTQKVLINYWLTTIQQTLGLSYLPQCERLSQVVEFLLIQAKERQINVAIDECQEINFIEPSFWSEVQNFWDFNRQGSQLFLMMSGSVASAMRNIFQEYSEPLYGRVNHFVHVRPFDIQVLEEIFRDYSPSFKPDDLLALYTLTGGVAWFVEELMEQGAFTLEKMADIAFTSGSTFINDGEILMANEFRADANVNRAILQGIASGITKREELQNLVGPTQISGALSRLEKQFELIAKSSPVMETNYRKSRYKMTDQYLMFWFTFVQATQALVESSDYGAAKKHFLASYETFSGRALEQLFLEKFRISKRFSLLGSWWDRKGENEIDLIAEDDTSVFFFEIKRNSKKINLQTLLRKTEVFLAQHEKLRQKKIVVRGLSLDDLTKDVDVICHQD